MGVSVVRQVKGGTATRQLEERRLIFQLGTLAPGVLNIDFKFFFNSSSKQRQRARAVFARASTVLVNFNVFFYQRHLLRLMKGFFPKRLVSFHYGT